MDENVLQAVAVLFASEPSKKQRSKWSKSLFLKRRLFSHINVMQELRSEPCDWLNFARMDEESYLWLLQQVTPHIEKQNTNMRMAVTAHERLSATLRFLISGSSYQCLRLQTAISQPLLTEIIPDTCNAIISVLRGFMKMPHSQAEWKKISAGFFYHQQFPNCLGATDG